MIQLLLNKTTPHFQLLPMPKVASPNCAFMRRRLYSKQKSKNIPWNALRGETGPDGQNIFGHTDVLINDIFCERQYLYVLRQ